jgi:hypothetical protein
MAENLDPIERLNANAEAIVTALTKAQEASLGSAADDILRRAMVLAIGSYFENRIVEAIGAFCSKRSSSDVELCEFVKNKALVRQYHTLFDWKTPNANKFFALFGVAFKTAMEQKSKADPALAAGIRQFMQLGALRNEIAHGNFAEVKFELSRSDILRDYKGAMQFVAAIETALGR